MATPLSSYEQETTINFNNEEKTAIVYTCNKALIRKLDKLAESNKTVSIEKQDTYSKTYIVPKKAIKISIRVPKVLTDEQREALSARAKLNLKNTKKVT